MAEGGNLEKQRRRTLELFFARWLEQLETSFAPRRARTLGALSALDELVALAEAFVRSGGHTRPAVDPNDAGHGVLMLPDVAHETGQFLSADRTVLTAEHLMRPSLVVA
jgi:hypothetical protein